MKEKCLKLNLQYKARVFNNIIITYLYIKTRLQVLEVEIIKDTLVRNSDLSCFFLF